MESPPGMEAHAQEYTNWTLVRRMASLGWQYRRPSIMVLVFQFALLGVSLGGLSFTGVAIDYIRHRADPRIPAPSFPFGLSVPTQWRPMAVLLLVGGLILALSAGTALLRYLAAAAAADLNQRVIVHLRSAVYNKLQRLSFRFYDTNGSSSIINRVTADVPAITSFIDGVLLRVVVVAITLVVYLSYMLSIHAGLTLACLAVTPLLWIGAVTFSRTVQPAYRQSSQLMDRLVRAFSENVQGMHVVKGFAREPEEIRRFAAANRLVHDQKRWIFWKVSLFQPMMGLLSQVSTLVLLGYGGYLVIRGQLQLGAGLFVFNGLLQEFSNQIDQITGIANSIQTALTGAQRVFEVLDAPEEVASPPHPIRLPRARGEIRFENVSFAYRSGERVLDDVSFAIHPGECVAIVGATGSGKSTLLNLIPRFYDASAGRVLVDGIDVGSLDLDDLRRNIGMVFQESFLFNDSVGANIAFGRPEASDEELHRAARIASADRFICELPEAYSSLVGERGSNLSGGQRQRLAVARALALDPPILLLDDATAAVDSGTEYEIQKAIHQAMKGRTTLLVAHRLSTLKRAGRIIVLEDGRITQIGTHEQLLEGSGHYRGMAVIQSSLMADAMLPVAAGG